MVGSPTPAEKRVGRYTFVAQKIKLTMYLIMRLTNL